MSSTIGAIDPTRAARPELRDPRIDRTTRANADVEKKEDPQEAGSTAATEPTDREIEASLERLGREIRLDRRSINFTYDQDARRVVIKVKDADNGEVIREIPPADYLAMVSRFRELFGIVVDEKV